MVWLALIHAAGWIVPPHARAEWRAVWKSHLRNLWILEERGELPPAILHQAAWLCRRASEDACRLRFGDVDFRRWVRGPGLVFTIFAAAFAIVAIGSHGFAKTRELIDAAVHFRSLPPLPRPHVRYDPRGDALVAYSLPVALALATGAIMISMRRRSLHRFGWRYWTFLAGKLAASAIVAPLVWIEGGAILRAHLRPEMLRIWVGALLWTVAFLGGFGRLVGWILADQQRRCPVCLRLLSMPVAVGSWSSVLEPAATELLCADGHGSLSVAESEIGDADRWVALDSTWRSLFDEVPR